MLRVKPSWVREHTRERCPLEMRVPCVKLGRLTRFVSSDIEAWIARGCKAGKEPRDSRIVREQKERELRVV